MDRPASQNGGLMAYNIRPVHKVKKPISNLPAKTEVLARDQSSVYWKSKSDYAPLKPVY